ncbi:hypothetical protein ACP70R_033040 [Stipagrostis hirtigluma subsp. patula]
MSAMGAAVAGHVNAEPQPAVVTRASGVADPRGAWGGEALFHNTCIMSVTIKMIHEAVACCGGGPIVVNRTTVTTVHVYGLAYQIDQEWEKGTFKIYDGSGSIGVSIWLVYSDKLLSSGGYVMVHGRVAVKDGSPRIEAYDFKRHVTDAGPQMVHHQLSVMKAHLDPCFIPVVRGGIRATGHNNVDQPREESVEPPPSPERADEPHEDARVANTDAKLTHASSMLYDKPPENTVLIIIRAANPEAVLKELEQDGEIYSTVDDDHFKAT